MTRKHKKVLAQLEKMKEYLDQSSEIFDEEIDFLTKRSEYDPAHERDTNKRNTLALCDEILKEEPKEKEVKITYEQNSIFIHENNKTNNNEQKL